MLLSRGYRKFRKSKLAMTSAVLIGLYVIVGVAIFGGLINHDEAFERVGPDSVPGFGAAQTPEKRYEDADFQVMLV